MATLSLLQFSISCQVRRVHAHVNVADKSHGCKERHFSQCLCTFLQLNGLIASVLHFKRQVDVAFRRWTNRILFFSFDTHQRAQGMEEREVHVSQIFKQPTSTCLRADMVGVVLFGRRDF